MIFVANNEVWTTSVGTTPQGAPYDDNVRGFSNFWYSPTYSSRTHRYTICRKGKTYCLQTIVEKLFALFFGLFSRERRMMCDDVTKGMIPSTVARARKTCAANNRHCYIYAWENFVHSIPVQSKRSTGSLPHLRTYKHPVGFPGGLLYRIFHPCHVVRVCDSSHV